MDIAELKEILRILDEQAITEFELEQDGVKLRVCRRTAVEAAATAVPVTPAAEAPAAERGPAAEREASPPNEALAVPEANGTVVKSPIVGTFYRAPDPNAPPFVSVGDQVKVGQVLCIVEAMKLMNEINAEEPGVIREIAVQNGDPVEYGTVLFYYEPV